MALVSYFNDPVFVEMERLMDRSLDKAFAPWRQASNHGGLRLGGHGMSAQHPMDVVETKDSYKITTDVPGFGSDDVKVEMHEGVLTISGQREKSIELKTDEGRVIKQERNFSKFSRTFTLPKDAKPAGIGATLDKGVLTVTVPKMLEPPKPEPVRIPINAA